MASLEPVESIRDKIERYLREIAQSTESSGGSIVGLAREAGGAALEALAPSIDELSMRTLGSPFFSDEKQRQQALAQPSIPPAQPQASQSTASAEETMNLLAKLITESGEGTQSFVAKGGGDITSDGERGGGSYSKASEGTANRAYQNLIGAPAREERVKTSVATLTEAGVPEAIAMALMSEGNAPTFGEVGATLKEFGRTSESPTEKLANVAAFAQSMGQAGVRDPRVNEKIIETILGLIEAGAL